MSFPKFVDMTKNTSFFPILHVMYPSTMYARTLPDPEKQPFFIREFCYEDDIQLQIQCLSGNYDAIAHITGSCVNSTTQNLIKICVHKGFTLTHVKRL